MNKLNHSRDMSFHNGFVSDDSLESMRDDLAHRDSGYQKAGKTVHAHTPIKEAPREFTADELFATRIWAARSGNVQFQFLVGEEYARRGNLERARHFLGKAASKGWPGAVEELAKLKAIYDGEPFSNGGKTIFRKGRSLKRGMHFVVDLARFPRVKYFRVVKVSLRDSVTKYAVLLKPTGGI